jgi:quinol monooxygenase YgiN
MVAVHVKLPALPGKGPELVAAFNELYEGPLEAEEGTVMHIIHQAADDPDSIIFYEVYTDQAALEAHTGGDALKSIYPKLSGLVAGRPEMIRLDVRNAKGLPT